MVNNRKIMLLAAGILAAGWLTAHAGRVMADDEALVQIFLALVYCVLVIVRRERVAPPTDPIFTRLALIGAGGLVLGLIGIVVPIRQFEWLGLLCILFACLRWGLPPKYGVNLPWGLLLLYLGHPLPGQLVGKFHLVMQKAAVFGAEWFLHVLNSRIWADGFILRDGFRAYGVPEACSGMRTAYTVLLCALGLGMALRRRWYEVFGFMFLGLVQVLLMNILRISFMVLYSPKMPPEWANNFLHDTLGIFLLLTIVLIHVEVSLWHSWRTKRERFVAGVISGEFDAPDKGTVLPGAWRFAKKYSRLAVVLVLVALLMFLLGYKRRASHRAAMMAGVIDGLLTSDPALACRAIDDALEFSAESRGLLSRKARALALCGRLDEALTTLDSLDELSLDDKVVKSSVLMMLGRPEEAIAIVAALPVEVQDYPGVAMLRAEYAAHAGDPVGVSAHLLRVGQNRLYLNRVRALFPYLAAHRQWRTLSDLDAPVQYEELDLALIAITAQLEVGRYSEVARLLDSARRRWPDEIRLVGPTFLLTVQMPGSRWERDLERDIYRFLDTFDADTLATYLSYCFRMGRADLAWLLYARLAILDPKDPALHLAVAVHGGDWFGFRHHQLGLPSDSTRSVVDVRPLCRLTRGLGIIEDFWSRIPFADDLVVTDQSKYGARHVMAALAELRQRKADGRLTYRLALNYARALVMAGQNDEALEQYDLVRKDYPEGEAFAVLQIALIHSRLSHWSEAYEALFEYRELTESPNLDAGLLSIQCLMNLNLGLYALAVAQDLIVDFPQAEEVTRAAAAIWDVFGSKEHALFLLGADAGPSNARAVVQLLHETGRYAAAQRMAAVLSVEIPDKLKQRIDLPFLPPAENSLVGRWPSRESDEQKKAHVGELRDQFASSASPFIKALRQAEAEWYETAGSQAASSIPLWEELGRNDFEKGSALHVLSMLLAQDGRLPEALEACRSALRKLPYSSPLWRVCVALTEEKYAAVLDARAACPSDPGIWLAYLVSRYEKEGAGAWMQREASAVTASRLFSVGAIVRAGSFFLRKGHVSEAAIYARYAVAHCQGLLAAYVLAAQCAADLKDMEWALDDLVNAISYAQDPAPFYTLLLAVKAKQGALDNDVVEALAYMQKRFPEQHDWSDMLGRAYFQRGDFERALVEFSSLIEQTQGKLRPQSLLMASEVARLEGNQAQAISILETAYALHSQSRSVLNNLIYNLSQDPATVGRAKRLLPRLLEMDKESYAVLETAALVHLRSGDAGTADRYMKQALSAMPEHAYGVAEARLNAAEISLKLGQYDDARSFAQKTITDSKASPADAVRAKRILQQIDQRRTSN